jgi:predicted ATPase
LMRVSNQSSQSALALRSFEGFKKRLHQELNLPPPTHLEQLANSIRSPELTSSPAPTMTLTADRPLATPAIPVVPTVFIGRELLLSELTNLLEHGEYQLLTLVGTGGVGKTRIALEIALEQKTRFKVGFVNLVPISTPSAIPNAIAQAIGLNFRGQDAALLQVINHISQEKMLLVIDNFEHVIAGAQYLSELVQNCPNLIVLTTSREPLDLPGEHILPVDAFAVPEMTEVKPNEIPSLEAVQLFSQHARRVRPDFRLGDDNLAQVLEICRLVDGLALGIELAAVWVRALPVQDIAKEIAQSLDFLSSNSVNLAKRHRSIRAAFEHSWGLLTDEEQQALRRLAVFRGGFFKEAVRRAAHVPLPVLGSLIDKSLLSLNSQGRYRRHRLLHQYMQDKLLENPQEAMQAKLDHSQYYFSILQQGLEGIRGAQSKAALEMLELDFENIHEAWRFAIEQRRWHFIKVGTEALMRFFDARGRYQEAIAMFAQAIEQLNDLNPEDHATLGTLLIHQSKFFERRGEIETAVQLAEKGLRLLTPLEERETIIWGLGTLGATATALGNHQEALAHRQQALREARGLVNERLIAVCLGWVAISEDLTGNTAQAKLIYQEAIYLFKKLGNNIGALFNLNGLATLLLNTGEVQQALSTLQETLDLTTTAGELSQVPLVLNSLAECCLKLGRLEQAQTHALKALVLEQQRSHASLVNHSDSLMILCRVALAQSDRHKAKAYLSQALGTAWEAQALPLTLALLLDWAEYLPPNDLTFALRLIQTVRQHPKIAKSDQIRATALLEARKIEPLNESVALELDDVIRQLRFG